MRSLAVAALLSAGVAFGDVVSFVPGGDADHPTELSSAANWSPAPPTENDVIEIDSGALGADTLSLAADLAVAGLRIKNSTQLLKILPADATAEALPRLRLGACGITNETRQSSANGLSVSVPIETTAPQTWFCGRQLFKTAAPFYGSSDLVIMRAYGVTHVKMPRYAGKITYRLSTYDWMQYVAVNEAAPWATTVDCQLDEEAGGNIYWQPKFAISGNWAFTDVFPEGSVYNANIWQVQTYLTCSGGTATMDEAALSRMFFWGEDSAHVAGNLNLVSGTFVPGAMFFIYGGGSVRQTGGAVLLKQGSNMRVGAHNTDSNGTATYVLDDGVCTNYAVSVGGMKSLNWYTDQNGIGRFKMNGGEFVILPNGHSYASAQALVLSGVEVADVTRRNAPGVFTQTGGTASVCRVRFGLPGDFMNVTGFGLLDLRGGRFHLGSGGFATADSWNRGATCASESNATYRVRLAGTEMSVAAAQGAAQVEIGCGDRPSVLSNAADHVVTAPVWGRGALRKRGAGNLTLCDAARFAGTLSVEQGTVSVGAFSDPSPKGACREAAVSLRAEDIADIEDGGAVAAWPTQDKAASAATPDKCAAPTFVKGGFCGYDAVHFDAASRQALALPKANIPWKGANTFTCAVVFRTKTKGPDSIWNLWAWDNRGCGLLSTAAGSDNACYGTMFLAFTSDGSVGARYNASGNTDYSPRGQCNVSPRKPCDMDDGEPHVAIFSSDGSGSSLKLRTMVDGFFTEQSCSLTSALDAERDLFIGAMNDSEAKRFFNGDIAEVKLFADALTHAEMKALTETWCAKYGMRPLTGELFAEGAAPGAGLGATNVTVASGATLALPTEPTADVTLPSSCTLANAGTVTGTLVLGDGARLAFGWDDATAKFGAIKATGTVTVDVTGIPTGIRAKKVLFTYDELDAAAATFVLAGANRDPVYDRLTFKNGTCSYRRMRGLNVIIK